MTNIAVVIPTHGRPSYLRQALDSVLQQEGVTVAELVVVDDVGTPETRGIVESFRAMPGAATVTYLHREAGVAGASASRNAGFHSTISPLVAFLDDDDLWRSDHLALAQQAIEATGTAMSLSWMNVLDNSGTVAEHFAPKAGLSAREVVARNPGITGSNIVVTRAAFERVGGFDEDLPVSNDKDFLVQFLLCSLAYSVVDQRTVTHRRHGDGQLTEWNERRAVALEKYLLKYARLLSERDRRFLERQIHSIRFRGATGVQRVRELLMLVVKTEPRDALSRIARRVPFLAGRRARHRSGGGGSA